MLKSAVRGWLSIRRSVSLAERLDPPAPAVPCVRCSSHLLRAASVPADEYANFVEINKLKLQGRLAWFIVPLIIAVVCFTPTHPLCDMTLQLKSSFNQAALFLDTLSDYTCDAWSPVCRSMSNYLAFAYYLVFIAVLVEFYRIYSAKGTVCLITLGVSEWQFGLIA